MQVAGIRVGVDFMMDGWQDIETAPKGGEVILGAWETSEGWAVYPILWRESGMYKNLLGWHMINWPDLKLQLAVQPTLWATIPNLPEDK